MRMPSRCGSPGPSSSAGLAHPRGAADSPATPTPENCDNAMDAVCSLIAPGLGQYLQGRQQSAVTQFVVTIVLALAFFTCLLRAWPIAWPLFLYGALSVWSSGDAATN